jgi:hypothetical protein
MNDTTSKSDKPEKVSPAGLVVFTKRIEQIDFLKKQEWTLTNYVAVIYGAIFGVSRFSPADTTWLQALIGLAGIYGFIGLLVIQYDLHDARNELDKTIDWIFGKYEDGLPERKNIVGPTGEGGLARDLPFLLGLMLVLGFGAWLAWWGVGLPKAP